ncbi:hypothetical protein COT48_03035 [Candidatus Woesearchaeota archaeon CG08_land_8_20_14_0_20_47_9]|nr:MAG: hypothetical protein AUJ69_03220 [Candidatus Woesearchaeota archaeon CG1_02_47_18]PIO03901.1 MAG: hypothetical protein COT48_03035 [Candidatus Woesearchaeota archaeon CG08_land_8_20_14_0_20_47_9]HII29694.1 hypothetical protein [Candidatus Woesearchaeota archaeon]
MPEATAVKQGDWIMFNNQPHQVKRRESISCGTHSHTKLKFYLRPLDGGGEKNVTFAHHNNVEVLDVIRKSGQVIAKLPGRVQVMDSVSYESVDAEASPELMEQIKEGDEVTFVTYGGANKIIEKR